MKIGIDIDGVILDYERVLKTYGDLYDFIELKKGGIINRNELIVISAKGGMIEEMNDVAIEKFKEEGISFNTYYWKQDDKLEVAQKENIDFMIDDSYDVCKKLSENGIKTIYFRDKEMKKLEQNEYLKEVSNWGEIYRIIKEMENR